MTLFKLGARAHGQRSIQWIVGATVLMVAASVLGSIALMLFAARTLDHIESLDERSLIQRTLARDLGRMSRELTSASVWNDAVKAVAGPVDGAWCDVNFGAYYSKVFGHDLTFVVRDGQVIYGAAAGARMAPEAFTQLSHDTSGLVGQVRARATLVHAHGGHGLDKVSTAQGLIRSNDEIYLVVASDILAETPRGAARDQVPPAVIVSVRRIGSAYVAGLRRDLGIDNLVVTDSPTPHQIVVPLQDPTGKLIGFATWPPTDPGMHLLRRAALWIGLVFLGLMACAVVLFLRVGEALRRLEASRQALIEAKDQAEAANVAKTQFLANMSHELRTPLNGVLGMTQVMQADELSKRQRERLAVVTASGQALLTLLNDILDMAKLEGRKLRVQAQAFDLRELVDETCTLFSGAASSKAIDLTADVAALCHGRWIGDAVRLRQILGNLIANAVKFTDQGAVTVRVRATASGLRFEIEDTGPGIAADDQSRLFKMFSQIDATSTRAHDGPGLGLAISHELVALMGGHMGVESQVRSGSVFYFEAPMQRAERPTLRLVRA